MINLPIPQPVPILMPENDDIGWSSYFDTLYDNRWLIVKFALIASLLGALYAFTSKPVYEANMLIHVEEGSGKESKNILGEMATLFDVKTATPSEMELLHSRLVVSRAIDNLHLYITAQPVYFPVIGKLIADNNKTLSTPGVFGFGGYAWGAEKIEVGLFDVPATMQNLPFRVTSLGNGEFRILQKERAIEAAGKVGSRLKIETEKGPITLIVNRLDAQAGADFILRRASRLDAIEDVQSAMVIAEQGRQSGIISISLRRPDPKIASAVLNEIGHEYIRQNLARKLEESEKSLAFLDAQLPDLKRQLEQAEAKYNQFRNTNGTVDLAEEEKISLQQAAQAKSKRIELQQKRTELLVRFMPDHPAVAGIDQQIREIAGELQATTTHIKTLPLLEQQVLQLNRDVKVKTELYTALSNTAQQLRLITIAKVGNVRLVDPAMVPEKPVAPLRSRIIGIATLIGLMLGIATVFIRKSLSGGIDDPREIEEMVGVPVYATIPHSDKQEEFYKHVEKGKPALALLARESSADVAIESLRSFRTALQFSMSSLENNILMVTGPTPGMGKTFVSVNLAAVIAMTGKRVLLIDADFRNGHLHQYFGRPRNDGLAEVIAGTGRYEQIVHRGVMDNLDFISTGRIPLHPSELLLRPHFGELMKTFSANYDLVLIDASPILAAADALIIGAHVGGIYVMARAGVTTASEIQEAIKRMTQAGLVVKGVLFNDSKRRASRYGYGERQGKGKYGALQLPGFRHAH